MRVREKQVSGKERNRTTHAEKHPPHSQYHPRSAYLGTIQVDYVFAAAVFLIVFGLLIHYTNDYYTTTKETNANRTRVKSAKASVYGPRKRGISPPSILAARPSNASVKTAIIKINEAHTIRPFKNRYKKTGTARNLIKMMIDTILITGRLAVVDSFISLPQISKLISRESGDSSSVLQRSTISRVWESLLLPGT